MVKYLFPIMIFFCFQIEGTPLVEATIDTLSSQAHYPLEGIITITHQKGEKIDAGTFTIDGKPLEVSLVREVLMSPSSNILVAIYHFELPAKEAGLYLLPSISVKIGDHAYSSIPSSYDVEDLPKIPEKTASSAAPLVFDLKAEVKGPKTLYPGERTKLFYRISYNRSIDLTKSELPMIHPPHFLKVGDVKIEDKQQGDLTLQDLTQEVEASETGSFHLGPSSIEGYAYSIKGIQKIYDTELLHAQAAAITIEVKPFPKQNQPPSFTGGMEMIKTSISLSSSKQVTVGDALLLQLQVEGISNLEAFRFPILQCQPGFSGFFQMSDLPPLAEVKGNKKLFQIELRPTTSLIHHVPSIELSSFNPESGEYTVARTDPIPITVEPHPSEKTPPLVSPFILSTQTKEWPKPEAPPVAFTISQIQFDPSKQNWLQSISLFWIIALLTLFLIFQALLRRRIQNSPPPIHPASEEMFQKGMKMNLQKNRNGLHLIEQAFWNRLWEKGLVKKGVYRLTGPSEIQAFLSHIQSLQFSNEKEFSEKEIKQKAAELFYKFS